MFPRAIIVTSLLGACVIPASDFASRHFIITYYKKLNSMALERAPGA